MSDLWSHNVAHFKLKQGERVMHSRDCVVMERDTPKEWMPRCSCGAADFFSLSALPDDVA